ncbi:MAG: hypothetical protein ABJC13_10015 [Acidobacteriota bacterium]
MKPLVQRFFRYFAFAMTACLATTAGLLGQSAEPPAATAPPAEPPAVQEPAPPAQPAVPQVTGRVTRFVGNEIELKTTDGKDQKVAINDSTKTLVEIAKGIAITVEYHRKIGGFILAERIFAEGAAPATEPLPAPVMKTGTATGDILSASDSTLVLRTGEGDVTFFLSPSTEILVKPLAPGLNVTVEYREDKEQSKVAIRIIPAKSDTPETPPPATPPASPPTPPPGD